MAKLPSEPSLAWGKWGGALLCVLRLPRGVGVAGGGEASLLNVSPSLSITQLCYDWGR